MKMSGTSKLPDQIAWCDTHRVSHSLQHNKNKMAAAVLIFPALSSREMSRHSTMLSRYTIQTAIFLSLYLYNFICNSSSSSRERFFLEQRDRDKRWAGKQLMQLPPLAVIIIIMVAIRRVVMSQFLLRHCLHFYWHHDGAEYYASFHS